VRDDMLDDVHAISGVIGRRRKALRSILEPSAKYVVIAFAYQSSRPPYIR